MTQSVRSYKTPGVKEVARVIEDSALEQYNESIHPFNEKARQILGKLSKADGMLVNSSPFIQVQLQNSGALPKDITRLATRKDLETAIALDETGRFLKENYVDFGLALKTAGDNYAPNDFLAKRLAKQLEARGIPLGKGKLIQFADLKVKEDSESAYRLVFDLSDRATKESVLDLGAFTWDSTKEEGLACARGRGRDWGSSDRNLGGSDDCGRVVGISVAEGDAPQNFAEEQIAQINQQERSQIAEIAERAKKAKKYLLTGEFE